MPRSWATAANLTTPFGDGWNHDNLVEEAARIYQEPYSEAWVLAGQRAWPPEDVGGTYGYEEMLRMLSEETASDEARDYKTWTGEDFDPELFEAQGDQRSSPAYGMEQLGKK